MIEFKYILFEINGLESPIVFSPWIEHDRMRSKFPDNPVLSAGFVKIKDNKVICYGKSTSLNIQSKESDSIFFQDLIENNLMA